MRRLLDGAGWAYLAAAYLFITGPMLFIAAGADAVVSTPAIERYVRRLKSASLLTVDGARHELLQEADVYREQLLAAFDAFVPGASSE